MQLINQANEFEWDSGNIEKSHKKHGISFIESEEVFLDPYSTIKKDFIHSERERRFVIIGSSLGEKLLFVVFTFRGSKIRVISTRTANKKERQLYEKEKIKSYT